jgi:hypothetical protein
MDSHPVGKRLQLKGIVPELIDRSGIFYGQLSGCRDTITEIRAVLPSPATVEIPFGDGHSL